MYQNDNLMSVYNLLFGHQRFLDNNTSLTIDRSKQHFVFNPDGVLSNNRHTIGYTRLESQPNGDATTEGQSLQILGYLYVYKATKDKYWLDRAIWCFDAYIKYFYQEQEIPDPPHDRWLSQWIINGKEPTLSNWPINFDEPTNSGFIDTEIMFVDGICQIPHGAPYWGEYLDIVTQAYRGVLSYPNINARVVELNNDGSINWSQKGESVELAWLIDLYGRKIDNQGHILEERAIEPKGYVKMASPINGLWKLCHANIQPVEQGGFLITRNMAWHNRPLNIPIIDKRNYGNAADAEEWFLEASYTLWKITNERRYWLAWRNSALMCMRYANIDSNDKFFRQSTTELSPFTDGISYEYHYPKSRHISLDRNKQGFIRIETDGNAVVTLEQQSISKKIDQNSKITINVGGIDKNKVPLKVRINMDTISQRNSNVVKNWFLHLPHTAINNDVIKYEFNVSSFIQKNKDIEYLTVSDVGYIKLDEDIETSFEFEDNIIDGRSAVVQHVRLKENSKIMVGFWLTNEGKAIPTSFTYKLDRDKWKIIIYDADFWRWYWILPMTEGQWSTLQLTPETLILMDYQPYYSSNEIKPTHPNLEAVSSATLAIYELEKDDSSEITWYCFNDVPPHFNDLEGWTHKFSITLSGNDSFEGLIGDCDISYNDLNKLAYTPGVIPFSNNSTKDSSQFDSWRGLPYPGYQHPFIYIYEENAQIHLENMCQFLFDAQKAYEDKFKIKGPVAMAYVWNRWDNIEYGEADTFIFNHWGSDAWAGYQPRAFASAARAWYELVLCQKSIPENLIQFTNNWVDYLIHFFEKVGGFPCEFPADSPPPEKRDFVGHMTGLWLCGLCFASLSGCKNSKLDWIIEKSVTELIEHYHVVSPTSPMNGSWSPAVRKGSDNGMFYGFWSGEILRGLGMYILYKQEN
jgi:hypothetical protein